MSNYPSSIYSPRTKENKAGIIYDPANKTLGYAEDVVNLDNEVVALETELGLLPKSTSASIQERLKGIRSLSDSPADFLVVKNGIVVISPAYASISDPSNSRLIVDSSGNGGEGIVILFPSAGNVNALNIYRGVNGENNVGKISWNYNNPGYDISLYNSAAGGSAVQRLKIDKDGNFYPQMNGGMLVVGTPVPLSNDDFQVNGKSYFGGISTFIGDVLFSQQITSFGRLSIPSSVPSDPVLAYGEGAFVCNSDGWAIKVQPYKVLNGIKYFGAVSAASNIVISAGSGTFDPYSVTHSWALASDVTGYRIFLYSTYYGYNYDYYVDVEGANILVDDGITLSWTAGVPQTVVAPVSSFNPDGSLSLNTGIYLNWLTAGYVPFLDNTLNFAGVAGFKYSSANSYLAVPNLAIGGVFTPDKKLHILGDAISADSVFEVSGYNTKGYLSNYQGSTMQMGVNRRVDGVFSNALAAAAAINLVSGNNSSYFTILTASANNTAPTQRFSVDKNGNVALGSNFSSGTYLLEIGGSVQIAYGSKLRIGSSPYVDFSLTSSIPTGYLKIDVAGNTTNNGWGIRSGTSALASMWTGDQNNGTGGKIFFGPASANFSLGGVGSTLTVDTVNLYLGINTTAPTAKLDVNSNIIRLRTSNTPATSGAAGNAGDICWDSGYIYVCVATNTWTRAALASW